MDYKKLILVAGVVSAMATGAQAATQSVTVNMEFDTELALTKNSDIDFGLLKAGVNDTYTMDTTGSITPSGAGVVLGGTPTVGDIDITGSTTQVIDITANNYVANGGVTPSAATCNYNGGGEAACTTLTGVAAPTGAGKNLLVGVAIAADGTQVAGATPAPTFDIVVNYQ